VGIFLYVYPSSLRFEIPANHEKLTIQSLALPSSAVIRGCSGQCQCSQCSAATHSRSAASSSSALSPLQLLNTQSSLLNQQPIMQWNQLLVSHRSKLLNQCSKLLLQWPIKQHNAVRPAKPSSTTKSRAMYQFMAGIPTVTYLGTSCIAEQMQVTPVLGPVVTTSTTFIIALVSSESCIRESSTATWSSGQRPDVPVSQLGFTRMTISGGSLWSFTSSYAVGQSDPHQGKSISTPGRTSAGPELRPISV
jgi:hypothetical protein